VTCEVDVNNLLDLRPAGARVRAGLTIQDLTSPTNDRDAYAKCQQVALIAHQLRHHGIVAPAATGLGETLALFMDVVPAAQRPQANREPDMWSRLPADPRAPGKPSLRVVRPEA
jgi:hypothetical protein